MMDQHKEIMRQWKRVKGRDLWVSTKPLSDPKGEGTWKILISFLKEHLSRCFASHCAILMSCYNRVAEKTNLGRIFHFQWSMSENRLHPNPVQKTNHVLPADISCGFSMTWKKKQFRFWSRKKPKIGTYRVVLDRCWHMRLSFVDYLLHYTM